MTLFMIDLVWHAAASPYKVWSSCRCKQHSHPSAVDRLQDGRKWWGWTSCRVYTSGRNRFDNVYKLISFMLPANVCISTVTSCLHFLSQRVKHELLKIFYFNCQFCLLHLCTALETFISAKDVHNLLLYLHNIVAETSTLNLTQFVGRHED